LKLKLERLEESTFLGENWQGLHNTRAAKQSAAQQSYAPDPSRARKTCVSPLMVDTNSKDGDDKRALRAGVTDASERGDLTEAA